MAPRLGDLKLQTDSGTLTRLFSNVPGPEKLRLKRGNTSKDIGRLSRRDAALRPANYCNDGERSAGKGHALHRKPIKEPSTLKDTDKAQGGKGILAPGVLLLLAVPWFPHSAVTSC